MSQRYQHSPSLNSPQEQPSEDDAKSASDDEKTPVRTRILLQENTKDCFGRAVRSTVAVQEERIEDPALDHPIEKIMNIIFQTETNKFRPDIAIVRWSEWNYQNEENLCFVHACEYSEVGDTFFRAGIAVCLQFGWVFVAVVNEETRECRLFGAAEPDRTNYLKKYGTGTTATFKYFERPDGLWEMYIGDMDNDDVHHFSLSNPDSAGKCWSVLVENEIVPAQRDENLLMLCGQFLQHLKDQDHEVGVLFFEQYKYIRRAKSKNAKDMRDLIENPELIREWFKEEAQTPGKRCILVNHTWCDMDFVRRPDLDLLLARYFDEQDRAEIFGRSSFIPSVRDFNPENEALWQLFKENGVHCGMAIKLGAVTRCPLCETYTKAATDVPTDAEIRMDSVYKPVEQNLRVQSSIDALRKSSQTTVHIEKLVDDGDHLTAAALQPT